jgi:hypothetical protein
MSANIFVRRILEWKPTVNMKKGKIERRWIGLRRCMNKRGMREENNREKDMNPNLVLVKENHCTLDCSGTNDKR